MTETSEKTGEISSTATEFENASNVIADAHLNPSPTASVAPRNFRTGSALENERPAPRAMDVRDNFPAEPPEVIHGLEMEQLDTSVWTNGNKRANAEKNLLKKGAVGRAPGFFAGETSLSLTILDVAEYAELDDAPLILIEADIIPVAGTSQRPSPLYRRVKWPLKPERRSADKWIYTFPLEDLRREFDMRTGEAWRLTFQLHFGSKSAAPLTLDRAAQIRLAGPFRLPSRREI